MEATISIEKRTFYIKWQFLNMLCWIKYILKLILLLLLYFPNGETKYASDNHLSRFVWFFSGILGGGLLVSRSEIITALKKISFLLDEMFSWKVFYKACFQIQDFCSFLFWKLIKERWDQYRVFILLEVGLQNPHFNCLFAKFSYFTAGNRG